MLFQSRFSLSLLIECFKIFLMTVSRGLDTLMLVKSLNFLCHYSVRRFRFIFLGNCILQKLDKLMCFSEHSVSSLDNTLTFIWMCHVLLSLKPGELEPAGPYDRNGKRVLSPRQTDSQVAKSRKFPAYTVDLRSTCVDLRWVTKRPLECSEWELSDV